MTIHSFDAVLRVSRRMHSFQPFPGANRVPLPRPVRWIAVLYYVAVLACVAAVDKAVGAVDTINSVISPLSGGSAGVTAWLICYVGLPAAIVVFAMNAEIDGRSPHNWLISVARFVFSHRRSWCGQRAPGDGHRSRYHGTVSLWWDELAPRLQHGFVSGGRVSTSVPVSFTHAFRHQRQVVRPDADGTLTDAHEVAGRLEVRRR